MLLGEEHLKRQGATAWSDPSVLPLVEFIINSQTNLETGATPHELHFGSVAAVYHKLPSGLVPTNPQNIEQYLRNLNQTLEGMREASRQHMKAVQSERLATDPMPQNIYKPGDLVLWNSRVMGLGMDKDNPWKGPYVVVAQHGNGVECIHTTDQGTPRHFHVDELKIFFGDYDQAQRISRYDDKQVVVKTVKWHKGDHTRPTSLRFGLELESGDTQVSNYVDEASLRNNDAVRQYCMGPHRRYMQLLLYTGNDKKIFLDQLRDAPPHFEPVPGQVVYVNLRCYTPGTNWYDSRGLPDQPEADYYVSATIHKNLNRDNTVNKKLPWKLNIESLADTNRLVANI